MKNVARQPFPPHALHFWRLALSIGFAFGICFGVSIAAAVWAVWIVLS